MHMQHKLHERSFKKKEKKVEMKINKQNKTNEIQL